MIRIALVCAAAVLAAGCSGSNSDQWTENRPKTSAACGLVTYKGAGVEGASVSFAPKERAGTAAFALTDADGKFTLSSFGQDDGAVPGDYTVTVTKKVVNVTPNPKDPNGPPVKVEEKSFLPARYATSSKSKLAATVSDGGENLFTFELKD